MRRLISRRPTAAMGIAFLALFVALSGVAVGHAPGIPGSNRVHSSDIHNGQVRSADLRNNDVRTRDIRNNDVRGGDVRNNTLTGADILESSLGTVPSAVTANTANFANTANTANTASNANLANRATSAANVDTLRPGSPSFLAEGETETLLTRGPITIDHQCLDADNDNVGESTLRFTTTEGAAAPGQISSALLFQNSGVLFIPGTPGFLGAGEGMLGIPIIVTGVEHDPQFHILYQLEGEGFAVFNAPVGTECAATLTAIE